MALGRGEGHITRDLRWPTHPAPVGSHPSTSNSSACRAMCAV